MFSEIFTVIRCNDILVLDFVVSKQFNSLRSSQLLRPLPSTCWLRILTVVQSAFFSRDMSEDHIWPL